MAEGYAPGYAADALSMMSARTAAARADFATGLVRPGMTVLDLGCGPGSISVGLAGRARVLGIDLNPGQAATARRTARAARQSEVDFVAGSAYALPLPAQSVDLVFSHALFEHLARPAEVLAELRRVLRPGGSIALSTSDWSRARLRPRTANVDAALRGHYLLRRRAGGDPFAGRELAGLVRAAGFRDVGVRLRYRSDLGYRELAQYVEARLVAALDRADGDREQLASAARSAWVWARGGSGEFSQCWVEVIASK